MFPELFKIGSITIPTYGFLLAIGVLLAIILSIRTAKRENLDIKIFSDFMFYTIISGLLGAKLFLFIQNFQFYTSRFSNLKNLLFEGGVFYGGLIFGAIFAIWYIKKNKLEFLFLGDIVAPSLALGHFFGRLGCYSAGCCYGAVAEECAIAVTFPADNNLIPNAGQMAPRYPVQLMEAILNLINFLVLYLIYRKKRSRFKGEIFILYIFNYSIIRFFIEYFRGDIDRGYVIGGLSHPLTSISTSQLISIFGFTLSIILYLRFRRKIGKEENTEG